MNIENQIDALKAKIELLEKRKALMESKSISDEKVNSICTEIGQRLSQMREVSGLRQQDLCEIVGLSRTTISNIERGEHSPTIPTLIKICSAIGCRISDIIKDEDIL